MTADPVANPRRAPVLGQVIGQPQAEAILHASLATPVHGYLLYGPAGSGKLDVARRFAAALVCPFGGCGDCPSCHDALADLHPDVTIVEREGASITVDDARGITLVAQRSPRVASRQVVVLTDFHLVAGAAPALLKTIEEPPLTTTFLILADALVPALTTIASRCVPVPFVALNADSVRELLIGDGVDPHRASEIAPAVGGNLDRARLLVDDEDFAVRQALWQSIPERLDGTGVSASLAAKAVLAGFDEVVGVLKGRQAAELAELRDAATIAGERTVHAMKGIEERHRREQRRARTDELRAGLSVLAEVYRTKLAAPHLAERRITALVGACRAIDDTAAVLIRNPNETLLLEALFVQLGDLVA